MPRRADPDPQLATVFSAADAYARGLSRDQVRQRVRSGQWVRVGRGFYRRSDWSPGSDLDEYARARIDHAHRAIAAAAAIRGAIVGFQSAAMLQRLPLFSGVPANVTLLVPPGAWSGNRPGLLVRQEALRPDEILMHRVPTTTAARTWFDIARTSPLADGLSAGDGGLRHGTLTMPDVQRYLEESVEFRGLRGRRRAILAGSHLSALRESVLESASWAYFIRHSIPLPTCQVVVRDVSGQFVARVDFMWEDEGIVGECDGRLKYDSRDANYREKLREDHLRECGLRVVRWGWQDVWDASLATRLRHAVESSAQRRNQRIL